MHIPEEQNIHLPQWSQEEKMPCLDCVKEFTYIVPETDD